MDVNTVFTDRPTLYEGSEIGLRPEVDLFSIPPTDLSTLYSSDLVKYFPLNAVRETHNAIEFQISSDQAYLDLASSYLHIGCKVLKTDGTSIASSDVVAPSNYFFHTLFKNLELYVNNVLVFDTSNNYAYAAYINRMLLSNDLEKTGKYLNELCYPNTVANKFLVADKDVGFNTRLAISATSKEFTMLGQLVGSLFQCKRYLPPSTDVRIILRRHSPEFALDSAVSIAATATCPYQIQITQATFLASKKMISPQVMKIHRDLLASGKSFVYPTNEIHVKTLSIAAGLTSATTDSVSLGKIPKSIVIGLVTSEAFDGMLKSSSLNFDHHDLAEVAISWNGDTLENRSIPVSFQSGNTTAQNDFLIALTSLQNINSNDSLDSTINRDNYKDAGE